MSVDVREPLKGILPELLEARGSGLDEAGTVELVAKLFAAAFGYDPKTELTREKAVQHTFVDLAVKLGEQVPLLIEVVAAETALHMAHLDEARRAALRDNVSYILLTNGLKWNVYRVSMDETAQIAAVFTVDLDDGVTDEVVQMLQLLHKESLSAGALDAFWRQRSGLGPAALGRALFSPDVLRAIGEQLREREQIRVDARLLAASLHEMLSPAAQLAIGPVQVGPRAA
jgi:hypothetical protein